MPPSERYDLAIVGAGAAGCAAAWSAARAAQSVGRSVRIALLDQSPQPGGVVTQAMHRSICGLYAAKPANPCDTLNAGAQRQVVEHMQAVAPKDVCVRQFGLASVLEFPPAAWQAALDDLCSDPCITRHFSTRVLGVDRAADRIAAIQTDAGELRADAFIDCSGIGHLVSLADAAHPLEADRPLGGYAIRLAGLAGDLEPLRLTVPHALAREPSLPRSSRLTTFYPGPGEGDGVLKLAINAGDDAVPIAAQILAALRLALPALRDAAVIEQSPTALPRDGRRLLGRATLTEPAVLSAERSPDDVALAWWPIEWWGDAGPTYDFPPVGQPYGITAAMLQSRSIENLFAAGSCLSATGRAAASARVSGICLATGDAAGRLAMAEIRQTRD